MKTSETINELATALAKAQGSIHAAEKDATNPHFGKSYATLAAVMDACRLPLSANGLSIIQAVEFGEHAGVQVVTRVMHASGQFAESSLLVPLEKNTPQGVASASTYGRRIGLSAMVGVVPDEPDDDGNAAEANAPAKRQQPAKANAARNAAPGLKPADELPMTEPEKLRVAECLDELAKTKSVDDTVELWNSGPKEWRQVMQDAVQPDCLKRKGELLAQGAAA